MLKWTASAQKLPPQDTPTQLRSGDAKRRCRRATIANKENIPMVTSTPMAIIRQRNSPLVLTPLADTLKITPAMTRTPVRSSLQRARRHSTLGVAVSVPIKAGYASTLPRYEEEYSPSTVLPTGQQLALRGLLPDPFLGNPRYFKTPELKQTEKEQVLPKKRKLEQEFTEIAQEAISHIKFNATAPNSTKMGDQTLDHLIDAILDSARKEEKKRKPRRSFNLRRRTLLRNQTENVNDLMLSPSYTPCDDPADDLNFPLMENGSKTAATTPQPATPPTGISLTAATMLCQLPTPAAVVDSKKHPTNDTFMLGTPVRSLAQKRPRQQQLTSTRAIGTGAAAAAAAAAAKRYKVDARNYFEIGLALPSIYV